MLVICCALQMVFFRRAENLSFTEGSLMLRVKHRTLTAFFYQLTQNWWMFTSFSFVLRLGFYLVIAMAMVAILGFHIELMNPYNFSFILALGLEFGIGLLLADSNSQTRCLNFREMTLTWYSALGDIKWLFFIN